MTRAWLPAVAISLTLLTPSSGGAKADDYNLLNLDRTALCGEGGTLQQSRCWEAEGAKADRWLQNIVASYLRNAESIAANVKAQGFQPHDGYDPVKRLLDSETLFEEYRKAVDEFTYDMGFPGSMRQLEAPIAYLDLTIERAQFLLSSCGFDGDLPATIDVSALVCPPSGE
jgi:hypothetical protein